MDPALYPFWVKLENQGRLAALQLIRRHRLLEVFLMQIMKFSWDQVDAESHRLEHAISMGFADRMDALCGYPTHCPHGDPIPTKEGYMPHEELVPLSELQPDQGGYLWRIATDDAHILRYLGQRNLIPGQKIRQLECIEKRNWHVGVPARPHPGVARACFLLNCMTFKWFVPFSSYHQNLRRLSQ